jgi:hypothetical protein
MVFFSKPALVVFEDPAISDEFALESGWLAGSKLRIDYCNDRRSICRRQAIRGRDVWLQIGVIETSLSSRRLRNKRSDRVCAALPPNQASARQQIGLSTLAPLTSSMHNYPIKRASGTTALTIVRMAALMVGESCDHLWATTKRSGSTGATAASAAASLPQVSQFPEALLSSSFSAICS